MSMHSYTVCAEHVAEQGCTSAGTEGLHAEKVGLRKGLPPLLVNLAERTPESVQWLGVAFGLTDALLSFWHRNGFQPVYLRQTPSDVTGDTLFAQVPLSIDVPLLCLAS